MLQLRTYKYNKTYATQYYYAGSAERCMFGDNNIRLANNGNYYFRYPTAITHADLPLHMNNINLVRRYFQYDEAREDRDTDIIEDIKSGLHNIINEISEDDCYFIEGYISGESITNPDYNYEFIDTDLWTEYKEGDIKNLFSKCVEQTSLRESERQGRNINQHIRVFKSNSKHILLMLTDYADGDQESETFLALGLVPVIFNDWKERFEQLEIDYFKVLVNRSQVKRISNVKATAAFNALESLEKYIAIERQIRYKTLFEQIAESRIYTAQNDYSRLTHQAEEALSTYEAALKKRHECEILINHYKEGTNDVIEELNLISKMKGVYDVDQNNNGRGLRIIYRVPLDYFDVDEAECAIKNVQDENVKRFITDIFIEQKYKLYVRVDSYFSYSQEDMNSMRNGFGQIDLDSCNQINALFNPHYQFFNCLGDYKSKLIKAMTDQDLTLFINIGLAAARSMNFGDGSVCNRWFDWLSDAFQNNYYKNFKCIEKDGQLYTLGQWLNNFEEVQDEETTN